MNRYGYTHKYGAKKTVVDGIKFSSKAEADRYCHLKFLERAGEIQNLRLQPAFTLQEAFTASDGTKIRALTYVADFQYTEQGRETVEDVKGFPTPEYKIKRKLFLAKYPEFIFKET